MVTACDSQQHLSERTVTASKVTYGNFIWKNSVQSKELLKERLNSRQILLMMLNYIIIFVLCRKPFLTFVIGDLRWQRPRRCPSSIPPFSHRFTSWLLWELHRGLLLGWGPSHRGRSDALLRAPDSPPGAAGPGWGDVGHRPHAAVAVAAAGEGVQELLQRWHPAWLHWHRDTHLICTVQRLHTEQSINQSVC